MYLNVTAQLCVSRLVRNDTLLYCDCIQWFHLNIDVIRGRPIGSLILHTDENFESQWPIRICEEDYVINTGLLFSIPTAERTDRS